MGAKVATVLLCFAGCAGGPATPSPVSPRAIPSAGATTTAGATAAKLEFVEDDYARALAEARAKKRPIFVDAWATWCHTCLSMREFVFPAAEMRAKAGDFVWLAIDTEKPNNADFVRTHPMEAWPTLWVIDSATEAAALKWNGSATAPELAGLLDDAKLAIAQGDGGGDAGAAYVRGNKETAAGRMDDAIASYRAALAAAPAGWPKRPRVTEALSARLMAKKDWAADVELAATELVRMPPGTSAKSVAYDALRSVMELKEGVSAAKRDQVIAATETLASTVGGKVLADDRSDLYDLLVDVLGDLDRGADKARVAGAWAQMLEAEAAKATTPSGRAVFDAHRFNAYVALGQPERAVPMLQASEKDFPTDYNPPARLASAYFKLKRYDDALAAIGRCLALGYGPRKLRHYLLKADILAAKGDKPAEKAALEDALAHARTLVLLGGMVKLRDSLEARLQKLK
jgi:tetratricopeptide (TPR) repeat protein